MIKTINNYNYETVEGEVKPGDWFIGGHGQYCKVQKCESTSVINHGMVYSKEEGWGKSLCKKIISSNDPKLTDI